MHPILFRIPLPHPPLKLWWALGAVAAIALVYAVVAGVVATKNDAVTAAVVAVAAGGAAWVWRAATYEAPNVPIYAYGVMLGISLVVGWYLTLPLAENDGLPKETMANCYVVTALAALAGSRVLYVVTNLDEFKSVWDLFALRNGGLVAYGGFIGGLLGSWAYLAPKQIRLLAWADDAVPSLASGLLITRDRLLPLRLRLRQAPARTARPQWLKTLGTFPHWASGTLASGDGSPAYVRHLDLFRGTPLEAELIRMNTSFPVHPTQLYESLVGLVLLALLLWQRKYTRFRGQVFFLFVFALRVSALPARALARRRRAGQLRADARRAHLHPALPLAHGAGLRLRHLARHREQARAHGGPRPRIRAAGRGVRRAQAGELRADRCRTSSRRASSSGCSARPRGLVLLRAVSGRRRARTRRSR